MLGYDITRTRLLANGAVYGLVGHEPAMIFQPLMAAGAFLKEDKSVGLG